MRMVRDLFEPPFFIWLILFLQISSEVLYSLELLTFTLMLLINDRMVSPVSLMELQTQSTHPRVLNQDDSEPLTRYPGDSDPH